MKITRVESFHVDWGAGRNRSAWVRIWTDAGLFGLGEASPMVHGNASLEIIATAFTPMLLGADPRETRVLQDRRFHQHIKVGPEGAFGSASRCGDCSVARGDASCRSTRRSEATVNGKFVLSDAPGLGLELNDAELQKRLLPWTSSGIAGLTTA